MKTITLINPEETQKLFSLNKWYEITAINEETVATLVNASMHKSFAEASSLTVQLGWGLSYKIALDEYDDEINLEFKIIPEIGVLVLLNSEPELLSGSNELTNRLLKQFTELYPKLKNIDLSNCGSITELSSISSLQNLRSLNLDRNYWVEDLNDIRDLKKLTFLSLSNCARITDLFALSSLNALKELDLSGYSKITDLSPLKKVNTLSILNLSHRKDLKNLDLIKEIRTLETLNLSSCINLQDLSSISGMDNLINLDLSFCEAITGLKPLKEIKTLTKLSLYGCKYISDLSPLCEMSEMKKLELGNCEAIIDLAPLSRMKTLSELSLHNCKNISDLTPLRGIKNLSELSLYGCKYISDLSPLCEMSEMKKLSLEGCEAIIDLAPLSRMKTLSELTLKLCMQISDLTPLREMSELKTLNLSHCISVRDLNPLSGMKNLSELELINCTNLSDLSGLNDLYLLEKLSFYRCSNISDLSPLTNLIPLTDLGFQNCSNLKDLSPLAFLSHLRRLDLSSCENLTRIQKICKLPRLQKIDLSYSPNIRDFEKLASLPELRELEWIDPLACSEVLMQCALNRQDESYILAHASQWIKEISRSKDAVRFCSLVLRCVGLLPTDNRSEPLSDLCTAMRERGLQAELTNDLDAFTWETWCTSVLELGTEGIKRSFNLAVANLDIARETEVVLGPLIVASASWIELHPSEKQHVLSWVHTQLQLLEEDPEAQRQIAPSAAVFFASLNDKEQVNFWLAKATDEKAPLWREKVLLALVAFYAKKQVFSEARRLISEMSIEDQKDKAIVETASAMAQLHPVDAAFLLDDVKDLNLSSAAARQLLEIPEVLSQPQGIYQLLLHLQGDPEELASCLEALIHKDPEGKVADAVSSLFVHQASSGPSASVLLELCKHPAITEFIPKRALDNYISGLEERAQIELASSVSHLVDDLQKQDVLKAEYAAELTAMMQG